jgi:hypothetical protein
VAVDGILTTAMTNSHIDHNTFTSMAGGIYGYPLGGNTVDGNTFDYVGEPIHFSCASTAEAMDVSGNIITHATRIGIELQGSINHLTVNNNYMSDWLQHGAGGDDSHIAISCATGGNGKAPYTDQAQHVTISNNVLIQNGPAQNVAVWAKSAIEVMGASDLNVTGNYAWHWGNFLLDGAHGGINSISNIVIGDNLYAGDAVKWTLAGVHGSGDLRYALSDPTAPAWRGIPTKTAADVVPPGKQTVSAGIAHSAAPKAAKPAKTRKVAGKKRPAKPKASQKLAVTIHSVMGR